MATFSWEPSSACEIAGQRLADRFPAIPVETVERCVRGIWVCALHTGAQINVDLLEALARVLLGTVPVESVEPEPKIVIAAPEPTGPASPMGYGRHRSAVGTGGPGPLIAGAPGHAADPPDAEPVPAPGEGRAFA